jgi:Glycosyltransferase WbsX
MSSSPIEDREKTITDGYKRVDEDLKPHDRTKLIAFYLPQYHPTPENDRWWGKGFTEWTNVAKSQPLFPGHYQPQLPADLGFYDLRLPETRVAQAQLAQEYGIYGFCYYHYWFNGRMILERPFNEVLDSGSPDFPFCLCWANENWSRRWDGSEQSILLEQKYDEYDPIEHITWLETAFRDSRYITIEGKPLLLVYKAAEISNMSEIIATWRQYMKDKGYPDLYICFVRKTSGQNSLDNQHFLDLGFDAHVDFQPDTAVLNRGTNEQEINYFPTWVEMIISRIITRIFKIVTVRYGLFVNRAVANLRYLDGTVFPCVFPSWDNTARRGKLFPFISQNNRAELYAKWLSASIDHVADRSDDEKIVFINAWNEWAEGCHLEPDTKHGREFLETTKIVLDRHQNNSLQQ